MSKLGFLAALIFIVSIFVGFTSPFLSWVLVTVAMLVLSGAWGCGSVTTKGCGLAERYNIQRDRSGFSWASALFSSSVLSLYLNVELFRWVASLVGDNIAAIGAGVIVILFVVGFIVKQLSVQCFNVGKNYIRRKLKAELAPKFGACYDARNNPEKAAELCSNCARAQEGLCPLKLEIVAQDAPHLRGGALTIAAELTITAEPLATAPRPAPRAKKQPVVAAQLDEILEGLQKAEEVFATQAEAGEPQICTMKVEGTWIATDDIDPQEKEALQQGQEEDLHLVQIN